MARPRGVCVSEQGASRLGTIVGREREMDPPVAYHPTEVVDFVVMPRGRPSPKVAITIDPDVYEGIQEAAERDGVSVSAWITAAARERLFIADGLRAVAEYEEENGAFTEAEMEAAHRRVDALLTRSPSPGSA